MRPSAGRTSWLPSQPSGESMLIGSEGAEVFASDFYTLRFRSDRPYVTLLGPGGNEIAELFAPSGVNGSRPDDTVGTGDWVKSELHDAVVFSLDVNSSLWPRKLVRFRCRPQWFAYEVEVDGTGSVGDVTYFGGYMSGLPRWGSGFFPSGHGFRRLFNPEPNTLDSNYLSPATGSVIDLTGAPLPGKRHWFFTPPPLCFALSSSDGWVGMGVEAQPGQNLYSEYRYHSGDGFWLSLSYDGETQVRGRTVLPGIGFHFGRGECAVLSAHTESLRRQGMAPDLHRSRPDWWHRPMFCGWGAQCARAADRWGRESPTAFLASLRHAPDFARQSEYETFLRDLSSHGLRPGSVVIDDKWQQSYGDNVVDAEKWPDLPGFIARRHREGQHVLLWLKAWDREGVPDDECIANAAGLPLAVDPTNPAFERRLRASVERMLSPSGYDADGFKIDFTHRVPVGPLLRVHDHSRGLELMQRYLGLIYSEAKRVKPDALIVTHAPHPYLAGVTDMIRLNDMLDLTRLDDPRAGTDIRRTLTHRAAIARIGCPDALIDTDNWPVRNRALWREYIRVQPEFGVPSLYFSTHIDLTGEALEEDDYQLIREAWNGIDSARPVAAG
jgi:hypothetical protein